MSRISFLGDVWRPRPVGCSVDWRAEIIFNLEAPITQSVNATPSQICLRTDRCYLEETLGAKPLAVCLANNHIIDYGQLGFRDTLAELRKQGIGWFGAGSLSDNCGNPLIVRTLDKELVGLLGYVCPTTHPVFASPTEVGVRPIDLQIVRNDVDLARSLGARRVVVQLHWGMEEVNLPRPEDIATAHAIAEMDVDLIVGHHAHCIQPWEVYHGTPVYYGLGNCLFPDVDVTVGHGPADRYFKRQMPWNNESIVVTLDVGSGSVKHRLLSYMNGCLRERSGSRPRALHLNGVPQMSGYASRFRRRRAIRLSLLAMKRFLSKPKLPRLRQISGLLVAILRPEDKACP